jgi:hypothetical protein
MSEMMSFPAGNAKVEKAIDENDRTIGVTVSLLVLPQDFDKLPGMFRQSAHDVYAAPRRT